MKKILKIGTVILICSVVFGGYWLINQRIDQAALGKMYTDFEALPNAQAVIVLGAKVYQGGQLSDIYFDRAKVALILYQRGKVEKILISGDHGTAQYDEVNSAKEFFLINDVPAEDIFLDHAGFDTYDSLYRAREIFAVKSAIIATNSFHLPRAIYVGEKLGLEVSGASSDLQPYKFMLKNELRERFARLKAWFNVSFHSKPKYLGDEIPITGDGQLSWD